MENSQLIGEAKTPSCILDARVEHSQLEARGCAALRDGTVAVLMVAGGLSTRLGSPGLRGDISVGPVTERSLFRLQAEKIAAIKRRYRADLLWLVMTSRPVHELTVRSFEKQGYFGLPPEDIVFFQQSTVPVVDAHGNHFHDPAGNPVMSPGGHGGMLAALKDAALIDLLGQRGIEHIYYFQLPNVLERVCDPVTLGFHVEGGFDITTKAISVCQPHEKMGRIEQKSRKIRILEYHFLDKEKNHSEWDSMPASIGTHVWRVSFLRLCCEKGMTLPYHTIPHRTPGDSSLRLFKREQFVFDLLEHSESASVVIVDRDEEYAPLKNRHGSDSLETARKALCRLYSRWLSLAGAEPEAPGACVEISPVLALCEQDLDPIVPPGFVYANGAVFRSPADFGNYH